MDGEEHEARGKSKIARRLQQRQSGDGPVSGVSGVPGRSQPSRQPVVILQDQNGPGQEGRGQRRARGSSRFLPHDAAQRRLVKPEWLFRCPVRVPRLWELQVAAISCPAVACTAGHCFEKGARGQQEEANKKESPPRHQATMQKGVFPSRHIWPFSNNDGAATISGMRVVRPVSGRHFIPGSRVWHNAIPSALQAILPWWWHPGRVLGVWFSIYLPVVDGCTGHAQRLRAGRPMGLC